MKAKRKSESKSYTQAKAMQKAKLGKFYIIVTLAIICSALISVYISAAELRVMKTERVEIEVFIEEEKQKQVELSSQKHYFESDSYIEKIAREKLGLVKPSDVVFIDRNK